MKKLCLFLFLCHIAFCLTAQEEAVIVMTTNKETGSEFSLEIEAVGPGTKVKIDYGDGIPVETTLIYDNDSPEIEGTVKGQTIKVYAKPTDILRFKCASCGLTDLDVSKNKLLRSLVCYRNKLTSIDVSNNPALINLYASNNYISEIDVSKNLSLIYLNMGTTNISRIDVSQNKMLKDLWIGTTKITEVNLSNNPLLEQLDCNNAHIKHLDLSNNKELDELRCEGNGLTSLDVSQNKKLVHLYCSNNPLTALDLSNNTELKYFECKGNKLSSIDLSNNTLLKEFDCSGNPLTHLDLSSNKKLETLKCSNTPLTILDLSHNPIIERLYCQDNKLSTLNISNNRLLKNIDCSGNQLKELDISMNPTLEYLNCSDNKIKKIDVSSNKYLTRMDISKNDLGNKETAALQNNDNLRRVDYSKQGRNRDESYANKSTMQAGIAMELGYSYKFIHGGLHQGYVGADLSLSTDEKRPYSGKSVVQFLIGGGIYYGKYGGESKAIPAVSLGITADPVCVFLFRATVTQYSINPSFGLNFLNLARLNLGYNFGYKRVNGFNMSGISIGFSIALGSRGYYVDPSN